MSLVLRAFCSSLLACGLSSLPAAKATEIPAIKLQIASQPVGDALVELARQSGLQVMFYTDAVSGFTAPEIVGTYTPDAALSRMLRNTPLRASFVNPRTVTISDMSGANAQQVQDQSNVTSTANDIDAPGPPQGTQEASGSVRSTPVPPEILSEVVVTGTQIRGVENPTAPVTVLDKSYIDSTGVTTTTGLLATLPQNFTLTSQSGIAVPGVTGNAEQGSSINLRAIGEGTTLVLLNGRRIAPGFTGSAVDISALPLSAIKRVEILTDGASAIYGSDAVGGVVNFILQDDFEGAQTNLRAGAADGGIHEYQASQSAGHRWESGNILISGEFYKRDLLPTRDREFASTDSLIGSLLPEDRNYSLLLSGRQALRPGVEAFLDSLYVKRKSFNQGGQAVYQENNATSNPQFNGALGLDFSLPRSWRIEMSAAYSRNSLTLDHDSSFVATGVEASQLSSLFDIRSAEIKADGTVIELPTGAVKAAIGVDWRHEHLFYTSTYVSGASGATGDVDRTVRSAFAESYIPIVTSGTSLPATRELDITFAARYDKYSDFGSSLNPKVGLFWQPVTDLKVRASYGTSYVAPRLLDYNTSGNDAVAFTDLDPASPSGTSHQLEIDGVNASGLTAQKSRNFTLGVEFSRADPSIPKLSLNYFNIKYRNEIAYPPSTSVILGSPAAFGSLIIRSPTVDQVNQAIAIGQQGIGFFAYNPDFSPDVNFNPASIDVIIDERRRNLSVVKTDGVDFAADWGRQTEVGRLTASLTSTYVFVLDHQVTAESQRFNTVGTFYNPPHLRMRLGAGWERGWVQSTVFLNHAGSYIDNRTSERVPVGSYTTVDARVAVAVPRGISSNALSGLSLALSVQNLFNRDPPRTAIVNPAIDLGFDPTNANPIGRMVGVEVAKRW